MRSFTLFFFLTQLIRLGSSTCWLPDGITSLPEDYGPCNGTAQASMCCFLSHDTCLPSGLCRPVHTLDTWRDGCTDPTWKSKGCLQLCMSGFGFNYHNGSAENNTVLVTNCENGSYCCGLNNLACCEAGSGLWIVDGKTTNLNPALYSISSEAAHATITPESTTLHSTLNTTSIFAATSSNMPVTSSSSSQQFTNGQSSSESINGQSSSSTVVAPNPSSQQSLESKSSSGLSTGAKVGLGVGIALGIALGILLGCHGIWRRRSRRLSTSQTNKRGVWEIDDYKRPVEPAPPRPELAANRPLVELF